MDLNRLTQGEKIAAGAAVLLFITMFFAWFGFDTGLGELGDEFGVSAGPASVTFNAWESFDLIDIVLFLTAVVAVATAALRASSRQEVDFPLSTVVTAMGAISTLLIVYRIIDPPGSADRKWGVFLGLIFAAALAYGGYRAMQEEGMTFNDAVDRFGGPGGGAGAGGTGSGPGGPGTTPPPPPPSSPPPPGV